MIKSLLKFICFINIVRTTLLNCYLNFILDTLHTCVKNNFINSFELPLWRRDFYNVRLSYPKRLTACKKKSYISYCKWICFISSTKLRKKKIINKITCKRDVMNSGLLKFIWIAPTVDELFCIKSWKKRGSGSIPDRASRNGRSKFPHVGNSRLYSQVSRVTIGLNPTTNQQT